MSTARDRPPEEAAEDTSFARGLRILLTIADRREIRADELGTLLDTPLSTVYRYLRTLAEFGFVERNGAEYRLGPRLLIGGGPNVTTAALVHAAGPVLGMLTKETGETAILVRRVGFTAVCLDVAQPASPLRVAIEPGTVFPLEIGAASRVLLAFAPPEILEELISDAQAGDRDPLDESELRAALAEILTTGMATSVGEITGAVALAMPVMRADGIAAAVGVTGPLARCGARWRARTNRLLEEASSTIGASLAFRSPYGEL